MLFSKYFNIIKKLIAIDKGSLTFYLHGLCLNIKLQDPYSICRESKKFNEDIKRN